jgi:hypothetical protein
MQDTRYPWDGAVRITVDPGRTGRFSLNVRIPGWARGEVVPSDLYRFDGESSEPVRLRVAGRSFPVQLDKGFVRIERDWSPGDLVELSLPMPVRRIVAHPHVEADRGRVAIQRGPLVYAAEWPDNPGGRVRNLVLANDRGLSAEWKPDLLNGVVVVRSKAVALAYDSAGKVSSRDQDFTAIPYYAWANRGRGQMAVWIAASSSAARPAPFPSLAITSTVKTSGRKDPRFLHDGEEPPNSADSSSYFDWWPTRGTTEWIEMTFANPAKISQVDVYWFDDTGRGQVRVPASWKLFYQDARGWKAVDEATPYATEKDKYNTVTFAPVTTNALRLEVTMQPNWSAGLQEWKVN